MVSTKDFGSFDCGSSPYTSTNSLLSSVEEHRPSKPLVGSSSLSGDTNKEK